MREAGTGDRRRLAWLNEGGVLLALTRNQNRPTYVAHIARLAPEFTRSTDESDQDPGDAAKSEKKREGGGTKPGMREAAKRLHERGILICVNAVPPRKRTATPHYSIDPSIKTLAAILGTYGTWVLGEMRRAGFSGAMVDGMMDEHLAGVFGVHLGDVRKIPKAQKDELAYLARASTKALEVFIDPAFELSPATSESAGEQKLLSQFGRLKCAMHLAFIAEVASSPGLRIWEEGWDVKVSVETTVKSGDIAMRLRTEYDSQEYVRGPEEVEEVHAKRAAKKGEMRAPGAR